MKKLLVVSALILTFALSNVSAQYSRAISVEPLNLLFSNRIYATYEHKLNESNSITAFLTYHKESNDKNDDWYSFGIGASYRWYLNDVFNYEKESLEGFSAGPFATIQMVGSENSIGNTYSYTFFIIGGEIAYKYVYNDWFAEPILRLNIGLSDITGYPGYSPITFGVNLGYAW